MIMSIQRMVLLVFFTIAVFAGGSPACAQAGERTMTWQREYAEKLFAEKNYADAAMSYAGVLSRDPLDRAAFDQLSASIEKIAEQAADEGRRCMDILGYLEFLRTRLEFYESSARMIEEQASQARERYLQVSAEPDVELLNEGSERLIELKSIVLPTVFGGMQDSSSKKMSVYEILSNLKKAYLAYVDVYGERDIKLRRQKSELEARVRVLEAQRKEAAVDLDITEIRGELALKNTVIDQQQKQLDAFSGRFDSVALEMDVLQQKLSQTSGEVTRLTQELADMSLNLYEGESRLADRTSQIQTLQQELAETKERLLLVQKIVTDKDTQILDLEKQVHDLGSNGGRLANGGLEELRNEVSGLRARIQDVALGNQVEMAKIGQQLDRLSKANIWLRVDNLKKEVQISRLRRSLQGRDLDLARINDVFMLKDRTILELNDRIDNYRVKIKDLTILLERREMELRKIMGSASVPDGKAVTWQGDGREALSEPSGMARTSELIPQEWMYGLSDEAVYQQIKDDLSESFSSGRGSF